jgi:hypothetical protein
VSDKKTYGPDWGPAQQTAAELGIEVSELDYCRDPRIFGCAAWWVLKNRGNLPQLLTYWERMNEVPSADYAGEFRNEGFVFPHEIRDDETVRFLFQCVMIAQQVLDDISPSA